MSALPQIALDALVKAVDELAVSTLGCSQPGALSNAEDELPDLPPSSLVAVTGETAHLRVAVSLTRDHLEVLSRRMLAMENGEDLAAGDMRDTLAEVVNIVAGDVKIALAKRTFPISIGLPEVYDSGSDITSIGDCEIAQTAIRWDDLDAHLYVLMNRGLGHEFSQATFG